MTGILVRIKHRFPRLWSLVEQVNGSLMRLRYPELPSIAEKVASMGTNDLTWKVVTSAYAPALSSFLNSIPPDRLRHFDPHPFDPQTIRCMASSGSFVMLKVLDGERIVGYHFLRCFFIGKAFHGLIVDQEYAGKGIGTKMWALGAEICEAAGLKMFATISKENTPSLNSCRKGCRIRIVEHLSDGYMLLSCKPHDRTDKS